MKHPVCMTNVLTDLNASAAVHVTLLRTFNLILNDIIFIEHWLQSLAQSYCINQYGTIWSNKLLPKRSKRFAVRNISIQCSLRYL
jgi:hypothetical protein